MGGGTVSFAMTAGGGNGPEHTANVETWDGSSWSEITNLPSSGGGAGGNLGTSTAGIYFGGLHPSATNATWEWNRAINIKTIAD